MKRNAHGYCRKLFKKHTEALVKDVGIEAACKLTGKSKATLGRYYSDKDEHYDRFMPIDAVVALEKAAKLSACDFCFGRTAGDRVHL